MPGTSMLSRPNNVEVVPRLAAGPIEIVDLVRAVERGLAWAEIRLSFQRARGFLRDYGVADGLLNAVDIGLETTGWDDAVAAFSATRSDSTVFYLGPIRAREGDQSAIGMVLGRRDAIASSAFGVINDSVEDIGRTMFGFPCSFRGREVEFFQLDAAAGGAVGRAEAPIALFTPFYLDGWSDRDRQARGNRTILWSSVVIDRHLAIARPLAEQGLLVDGTPPAVLQAPAGALHACVGLWLSLHELFHSSGPLPLFEPLSGKYELSRYGVVEESRVDMSAFLAMARHREAQPLYRMTAELILVERLLRSARCGAAEATGGSEPSLDGQHGLFWAGVLRHGGALRPANGSRLAAVDFGRAVDAVSDVLRDIYEAESATVDDPGGRRAKLNSLAARMHAAWLGDESPGLSAVLGWPVHEPVAACLRPGPLAVQ